MNISTKRFVKLRQPMRTIDAYSYHCGVMDAFCEVVGAGVKQLALSHPFSSLEEMQQYLPYAEQLCKTYHIEYYPESSLLITDLFPASMNKGKHNILFFKEHTVLETYLHLKEQKAVLVKQKQYENEARKEIALAFGKLLSYDESSCLDKILHNTEKE